MTTLDPTLLPILHEELRRAADLTAVERFSQHEHDSVGRYVELMPASPPGPGQQLAFEVDLGACTGCKACVTGCHSMNGLDEVGEVWRRVGDLGRQHVTTACHHCVDPACLKGCPANAYEKDALTGAVIHLDDACIGCTYCTMTCPYEVPAYNDRLGIVRKCDLCHGRLAAGEAPACVQACPTEAIRIRVVDAVRDDERWRLPAGPSPSLTGPTTSFVGAAPAYMAAGDDAPVAPRHGEPPLVVLLVASQWAVGAAAAGRLPLAAGLVAVASLASVAHLGRPLLAWRAVLGWRRSWLSREVLAIGAFAGSVAAGAVLGVAGLRVLSVLAGAGVVVSSAGVYAATRRRWWSWARLLPLFAATAAVGAVVAGGAPAAAVAAVVAAKLAVEGEVLLRADAPDELRRTARLLRTALLPALVGRVVLAVAGVAVLGAIPVVGAAALLAGDLVERSLRFRAVSPDRMP